MPLYALRPLVPQPSTATPGTVSTGNHYVVTAAAGSVPVTLPALASLPLDGDQVMIEKDYQDTSTNPVVLTCAAGDTFESGGTTISLTTFGERARLQSATIAGVRVWKVIDRYMHPAAVTAALTAQAAAASTTYATLGTRQGTIALGVAPSASPTLADVTAFNAKIAPRSVDTVLYFSQFPADPVLFTSWINDAVAGNYDIDVAWSNAKLSSVVDGSQDTLLAAAATKVKQMNRTVHIRLCHEFNLGIIVGSAYGNGNETPAQFIAGWQYVVNYFRSHGASNVDWRWSPNIWFPEDSTGATGVDPSPFYPGDAYVDTVGLDGYMTSGRTNPDSFATIFLGNWAMLSRLAPTKPFWIFEVGVAEQVRTNKAQWMTDMWATLRTKMPNLGGVQYWNRDGASGATGTQADVYTIDSGGTNTSSKNAFVGGVNSLPFVALGAPRVSTGSSGGSTTGVALDTDGVYYPSSSGTAAIVADTDGVYYPAA